MKHLKRTLMITVLFSCMSTIAQEDQQPTSSKATHIAKAAGYSAVTAANAYLVSIVLTRGLKDYTSYGLAGALSWLSKHTGTNAWKEYKEAFPDSDHTLSPKNTHIAKTAGYLGMTASNTYLSYKLLSKSQGSYKTMYLVAPLVWVSKQMGTNAWKEYKEAFPSTDEKA